MNFRNVFLVLFPSWNRLLYMGKNCMNWWGCLVLSGTPAPIQAWRGASVQGVSCLPGAPWSSSQQFALYLTGDTMTFHGHYFHISLIYEQCLPLLEGLWIHIPRAYTLCICEASSEDPLGSWTFPLCKSLATSWANWLQGGWGFREGIHSGSVLMESSAIYWLQWISLRPWRIRASCMKLGWRSQNCKTSSQIPAGMRNLATRHSPLFAPLNYFPC